MEIVGGRCYQWKCSILGLCDSMASGKSGAAFRNRGCGASRRLCVSLVPRNSGQPSIDRRVGRQPLKVRLETCICGRAANEMRRTKTSAVSDATCFHQMAVSRVAGGFEAIHPFHLQIQYLSFPFFMLNHILFTSDSLDAIHRTHNSKKESNGYHDM